MTVVTLGRMPAHAEGSAHPTPAPPAPRSHAQPPPRSKRPTQPNHERGPSNPRYASPSTVLALQRRAGNQAVVSWVSPEPVVQRTPSHLRAILADNPNMKLPRFTNL